MEQPTDLRSRRTLLRSRYLICTFCSIAPLTPKMGFGDQCIRAVMSTPKALITVNMVFKVGLTGKAALETDLSHAQARSSLWPLRQPP
ncbi:hypothetical protein ALO41_200246 [Pseudomonas amygdali pv. ulmi]|uniref:Uncharacterized protein n=1 Tax=Pseudomonas amygdali pv. ulmi TaxID=251720 RepID=A0A0Q0CKV5_PSEA0|nr:hypothetical protein ALO41_200246 [Pseudomonas amygdali pv. ulmi]